MYSFDSANNQLIVEKVLTEAKARQQSIEKEQVQCKLYYGFELSPSREGGKGLLSLKGLSGGWGGGGVSH